ncbi:hypothetical protein O3P69_002953 [Scylla paramamosain]|uniref:NACHT domain-containing protein n=1 Tax=Scylla paramamosain TaxID=85552 RepID=A0AAW0UJA5_SCYPA
MNQDKKGSQLPHFSLDSNVGLTQLEEETLRLTSGPSDSTSACLHCDESQFLQATPNHGSETFVVEHIQKPFELPDSSPKKSDSPEESSASVTTPLPVLTCPSAKKELQKHQNEMDSEMQKISQITYDLSLNNEWKEVSEMRDKVILTAQKELKQLHLYGEDMQNMSPITGSTDSRHKALTIEALFMERQLEDKDDVNAGVRGTYKEPQVLFVIDGYDEAGEEAKGLIDEILTSLPDSKMIITTKTQWAAKLIDKVQTVTFNYKVLRIEEMTEEMRKQPDVLVHESKTPRTGFRGLQPPYVQSPLL